MNMCVVVGCLAVTLCSHDDRNHVREHVRRTIGTSESCKRRPKTVEGLGRSSEAQPSAVFGLLSALRRTKDVKLRRQVLISVQRLDGWALQCVACGVLAIVCDAKKQERRETNNELDRSPKRVSSLSRVLHDVESKRDLRARAAITLARIRTRDSVAALAAGLRIKDVNIRASVVACLGSLGRIARPIAEIAASGLHNVLLDKRERNHFISRDSSTLRPIRYDAAVALGRIGFAEERTIKLLTRMMHTDVEPTVRLAAAYALWGISTKNMEAQGQLVKALRHPSPKIRAEAIGLLAMLGAPAKPAVLKVAAALKDVDKGVRGIAAIALGAIKARPKEVIPALAAATRDEYALVRRRAVEALGEFGGEARRELTSVKRLLSDFEDPVFSASVRYHAVMALSRILNAKELVPVLADALFDEPSSHVKLTIMTQLNAVGRPAVKALPALRRLLRDQDDRVRLAAKDLIEAVEALPETKR